MGRSIKRLYAHLAAEGKLGRRGNPAADLRPPAVGARSPRPVTDGEDEAILAAAERVGGQAGLVVLLMRRSGLRIGEIMGRPGSLPGIRRGDVDASRRLIRVVGKGGREEPVFLHQDTLAHLEAVARRATDRRPEAPLFQRRDGSARSVRWAHRAFGRVLRAAGVSRRVTPHMMRHTFATRFLESGGDVRAVQRLLRHRRLATTLLYADYSTDEALRRQFDEHGR